MDIEAIEDSDSLTETSGGSINRVIVFSEPVVIRGCGNLTVFGLNNRFKRDFPPTLLARVAPEEFQATIDHVNSLLGRALPMQMKWILFGCLCCCCTLGCSFWPVICMSRKTRLSIEKLLEWENSKIYNRLGLKWHLRQMHLDSSSMLEYALVIEFLPKQSIYRPD